MKINLVLQDSCIKVIRSLAYIAAHTNSKDLRVKCKEITQLLYETEVFPVIECFASYAKNSDLPVNSG
jgi:hypothetical protein